jgi:phenylpropionate dioxygenase-like ring-hydroxylating dioxygenase large terminal subunit
MEKFVLNTWYPIAWSREISHALVSRRVVEKNVVLYRKSSGHIVALEDLCPHRLLPLSMGTLKGDNVQCGYHGMTFDCSGKCIRIPGQATIPSNASVTSYPVHEQMGLVWIWTGDPKKADVSTIYKLPQYDDPKWSAVEGDALEIKTHYLSLADNLCDPSHVSFVHLGSLGTPAGEDIPVHYEKFDERLVTWRWIIDAEPIPLFKRFGNFKGNVDRWHYYHYYAPSIAVIDFGTADTGTGAPEGNRDNCVHMYACHFMTPVDENTTIDHWLHVKNFHADAATNVSMTDEFRKAFAEDKAILEAIHASEKAHPERRPLKLAVDVSPTRMRRMIEERMREEQAMSAS